MRHKPRWNFCTFGSTENRTFIADHARLWASDGHLGNDTFALWKFWGLLLITSGNMLGMQNETTVEVVLNTVALNASRADYGGAIAMISGSRNVAVSVENASFTGHHARKDGGAIFVGIGVPSGQMPGPAEMDGHANLSIVASSVQSTASLRGGAINVNCTASAEGSHVYIESTNFVVTQNPAHGGAILSSLEHGTAGEAALEVEVHER